MAANRPTSVNRAGAALWLLPIAVFVAAPIAAALWNAASAAGGAQWLLAGPGARYAVGTLALCLVAGAGAAIIGAVAASVVCLTEFPGRRTLAVSAVLPFAVPAYIAAYAYGDFFGPFGPVAAVLGAQNTPEIRSFAGAAFILMLSTYAYVYLAMAASLSVRSAALMEAARMLGAGPAAATRRVLVAAGRPALAGGLALALMEIAAEFGVADYFGVATLSVGIFRTWYGLGDLGAATQLAAVLFFAALVFVLFEALGRRGRAAEAPSTARRPRRIALSRIHAFAAQTALALPILFGFVIPAGVLAAKLGPRFSDGALRGLGDAVVNTGAAAIVGAGIALCLAVILAYATRRPTGLIAKAALRLATLGYAVPGAVLAIGLLALAAPVSKAVGAGAAAGLVVLFYAYAARFLTVAFNAVSGGLEQINPQMDAAARTLGAGAGAIARRIHGPQLTGAAVAGGAIVAIDIAKELPATLLLRPFNFETLATRVYRLASDERLADAAPAALVLIGLGLIPALMVAGSVFASTPRRDRRRADRRVPASGSAATAPPGDYQGPAARR